MRSDLTYRFSIVNFSKPDSLYNYGMKPVLYSQIEAERHFVGWSRVGSNIRYVVLKVHQTLFLPGRSSRRTYNKMEISCQTLIEKFLSSIDCLLFIYMSI